LCILGRWKTPYLKTRLSFVGDYLKDTLSVRKSSGKNFDDYRNSVILKNMELIYGVFIANTIINHVSQYVGKSRAEILSNFETFSKNMIQVYGELEGRKFLSKLPVDVLSLELIFRCSLYFFCTYVSKRHGCFLCAFDICNLFHLFYLNSVIGRFDIKKGGIFARYCVPEWKSFTIPFSTIDVGFR